MIEFKCKDGVTRLEISLGVTTFGLLMSDTDQNLFKGFGHIHLRLQFSAISCKAENNISYAKLNDALNIARKRENVGNQNFLLFRKYFLPLFQSCKSVSTSQSLIRNKYVDGTA